MIVDLFVKIHDTRQDLIPKSIQLNRFDSPDFTDFTCQTSVPEMISSILWDCELLNLENLKRWINPSSKEEGKQSQLTWSWSKFRYLSKTSVL